MRVPVSHFLANTVYYSYFKVLSVSLGESIISLCFKLHLRLVVTLVIFSYVYETFIFFFVNYLFIIFFIFLLGYFFFIYTYEIYYFSSWLLILFMISFEIQSKLSVVSKLENIVCLFKDIFPTPKLFFKNPLTFYIYSLIYPDFTFCVQYDTYI